MYNRSQSASSNMVMSSASTALLVLFLSLSLVVWAPKVTSASPAGQRVLCTARQCIFPADLSPLDFFKKRAASGGPSPRALAEVEIELPALQLHGRELSSQSGGGGEVGLLSGPAAPLGPAAKVSEKRKPGESAQQNLDYDGAEPRRKNRNRDFQTNGW